MSLDGLARVLANDETCRNHLLENGRIFRWPSADQVGVVTRVAVPLNEDVLLRVIQFWCPQWTAAKMIPVNEAKCQALRVKESK